MLELRKSTVADINLGQFVDKDDGVTPETGLAGTMTVELSKNGGAFAARSSAVSIAHQEDGFYKVRLDATDTDTLGRLKVKVVSAGVHLGVWLDVAVVSQAYWDAKYGTGALPANVTQIGGSATPATALAANIANLDQAISALENLSAAEAKAALDELLFTDATAEGAGVPDKDAPLGEKIEWLFQHRRNKNTASSTAGVEVVYNDAGVAIGSAAITDSGGVTSRGKFS